MISFLKGTLKDIQAKNATIMLNTGVGYLVNINNITLSKLETDQEIELHIYTAVRETDISLYGFLSKNELEMFKLLISVKGVGPKSGIDILSEPVNSIKTAIVSKDEALLSRAPGIGKRTAQRIIVELENKIDDFENCEISGNNKSSPEFEDAIHALENLGYQKHQIIKSFKEIPTEIKTAEEIIRYYLSNC